MKIEHAALYTEDLERMRSFFMKYFEASSNELYHNPKTGFTGIAPESPYRACLASAVG